MKKLIIISLAIIISNVLIASDVRLHEQLAKEQDGDDAWILDFL